MEARVDQLLRMADLVPAGDIDSRSRVGAQIEDSTLQPKTCTRDRAHEGSDCNPVLHRHVRWLFPRGALDFSRRREKRGEMQYALGKRSLEWSYHGTERVQKAATFRCIRVITISYPKIPSRSEALRPQN